MTRSILLLLLLRFSLISTQDDICAPVLDIVILFDTSGGMDNVFMQQKNWTIQILKELPIHEDAVRLSFIQYAEEAHTEFNFKKYFERSDMLRHLESMSFLKGNTKTGSALEKADDELFSYDSGARLNSNRIIILFTDGLTMDDPKKAAKALRRKGVKIYAISVNSIGFVPDMLGIVGDEQNIFGPMDEERITDRLLTEVERSRFCNSKPRKNGFLATTNSINISDMEKTNKNRETMEAFEKALLHLNNTDVDYDNEFDDDLNVTTTSIFQAKLAKMSAELSSIRTTPRTVATTKILRTTRPVVTSTHKSNTIASISTTTKTTVKPTVKLTTTSIKATTPTTTTTTTATAPTTKTTTPTTTTTKQPSTRRFTPTSRPTLSSVINTTTPRTTRRLTTTTSTEKTTPTPTTHHFTPTRYSTLSIASSLFPTLVNMEKPVTLATVKPSEFKHKRKIRRIIKRRRNVGATSIDKDIDVTEFPKTSATSAATIKTTTVVAVNETEEVADSIDEFSSSSAVECPMDILFVVDSSGSIADNYQAQKQFLTSLIKKVEPARSHRVGLIQFAGPHLQKMEWSFDHYSKNSQLLSAIKSVRHLTGTTYIGAALELSLILLESRRKHTETTVILVSDGFSQDDSSQQAKLLRQLANVKIYAVSLTKLTNTKYLTDIVGDRKNLFVNDESKWFEDFFTKKLKCTATQQ